MSEFETGEYTYTDKDGKTFPCEIINDNKMPMKLMVVFEDSSIETEWPEILIKQGSFEKLIIS